MFPIFSLWKRALGRHNHLFNVVSCNDCLSIDKIQFCKDIIEEENDRKLKILSQKENLDLLESEENDFVLTS